MPPQWEPRRLHGTVKQSGCQGPPLRGFHDILHRSPPFRRRAAKLRSKTANEMRCAGEPRHGGKLGQGKVAPFHNPASMFDSNPPGKCGRRDPDTAAKPAEEGRHAQAGQSRQLSQARRILGRSANTLDDAPQRRRMQPCVVMPPLRAPMPSPEMACQSHYHCVGRQRLTGMSQFPNKRFDDCERPRVLHVAARSPRAVEALLAKLLDDVRIQADLNAHYAAAGYGSRPFNACGKEGDCASSIRQVGPSWAPPMRLRKAALQRDMKRARVRPLMVGNSAVDGDRRCAHPTARHGSCRGSRERVRGASEDVRLECSHQSLPMLSPILAQAIDSGEASQERQIAKC